MMNVESTKDNRVWHSGPPPFIGWWNASNTHAKTVWRWWDGGRWSVLACEGDQPDTVAYCASIPTEFRGEILWNDYWPEDAVCPRVDPASAEGICWEGRFWVWRDGELTSTSMGAEGSKSCRVWHNGPPPHIGWWNASATKTENLWRWWNGDWWSIGVFADASPERASKYAAFRDTNTANTARIEWNDYWPEDAVCPRINPGHNSPIWKGRMWAWVNGELVSQPDPILQQVEEFRRFALSVPSLETVACPNHKFVDTKAIQTELQNISVELADIEDKVANIVHCLGRVRKVLRGE